MADTRAIAELTPTQWDDDFNFDYFQSNPFARYMRNSRNAVIHVNEELSAKPGQTVRFAFTTQLNGPTVYDDAPLIPNAESLGTYYDDVTIRPRAKAVNVSNWGNQLSAINLREAGREGLTDWTDRETRDMVITALGAVGSDSSVPFATATTGQKNDWSTANPDRVLYGKTRANYSGTFLSGTAAIDVTDDRCTRRAVSLMKRMALMASPAIAPIRNAKNGRRYFIGFAHPYLFRDLAENLEQSNREVRLEDKNTILFEGGDLYWDGVIVHEVDNLPVYAGIGNACDVAPFYLCGQQALGFGWGKRWKTEEEKVDLGRQQVVGMEGWNGVKKLTRKAANPLNTGIVNKQVGIVTGFFAATGD